MRGTTVNIAGHALCMLPSGACFHLPSQSLLIADAHLGKDASFRALGMPVPGQASTGTLAGLAEDLAQTSAHRLIFLGDFLHAARSKTPELLGQIAAWRQQHAEIDMLLIRGNHDQRAGDPPPELRIEVMDEPNTLSAAQQRLPLALCHHPQIVPGHYSIAGHWHPCVRVSGAARQSLRLPCFWWGDEQASPVGVLPAYGEFTGAHPIDWRAGDRVYAIAGDSVQNVPKSVLHQRSPRDALAA